MPHAIADENPLPNSPRHVENNGESPAPPAPVTPEANSSRGSNTASGDVHLNPHRAYASDARLAAAFGTELVLSSCSENSYIPTPFNTPNTSPFAATRRPPASSGPAPSQRGSPSQLGARQSGGGPKKKIKFTVKPKAKTAKEKILDNPEKSISSSKSPLYEEDVLNILSHADAQTILEKATVDDGISNGALSGIPQKELRQAADDFTSDGIAGLNNGSFLEDAFEAHVLRGRGDFDEFLQWKFDNIWGIEGDGVKGNAVEGAAVEEDAVEEDAVEGSAVESEEKATEAAMEVI